MFELLTAMEEDSGWKDCECYDDVRMPAFIMERFFSIWLRHQCTQRMRLYIRPSCAGRGHRS